MDAVMFRNYRWYGIELGQKEARYWGSPLSLSGRVKVRLKDYLLNRIRFSPFDVSESACRSFVEELRRFAPDYIYGYAQTIYRFAEFILKADIDLSDLTAKAVIVTGEMISVDQIEKIKEAFKCPVSNEYGCTEVGIIAMTCSHDRMHLMADNLFVEFMKNGKHSEPGEEGEIIVTELYGRLMPLIRYQVGDVGYFDDGVCSCGRGLPLLGGIKGRNDEFILCANGKQIDPIIFEYILAEIPERYGRILQFRITQEKGFKLNIEVVYEGRDFQAMIRLIQEKLQWAVGPEFDIEFSAMETIQAEASGKLRCFISRVKD
jgi:phenylacetate-CoA ligase